MITAPSAFANYKQIPINLTDNRNEIRVNEIISVDDFKFEIKQIYEMNYFQRNFAVMQKKYPNYQFIVKDNQLIVVAKEIKQEEWN